MPRIGGPGAEFVGVGGDVFGLTPDRQAVYHFNHHNNSWGKIGGPGATLATAGGVDTMEPYGLIALFA